MECSILENVRTALYEINFGGKTDVQHRKLSKRPYRGEFGRKQWK